MADETTDRPMAWTWTFLKSPWFWVFLVAGLAASWPRVSYTARRRAVPALGEPPKPSLAARFSPVVSGLCAAGAFVATGEPLAGATVVVLVLFVFVWRVRRVSPG